MIYTRLSPTDKRKKINVTFVLKHLLLLLLLFFTYNNCTACAQTNITLEGTIYNIPSTSPKNIHLYSYYGKELSEIDLASVDAQGKFKIELPPVLHQGLYELGFDSKNTASIVLSPEEKNVTIQADYKQFVANDNIVINSRENDACRVLLNEMKRFLSGMKRLIYVKVKISKVDPFFVRKTKAIEAKITLHIKEHNEQLILIKESYPYTFASEVLVSLYLWPQMTDYPAIKDSYDNERAFMHDYFFEFVDFSDERIIYSPALAEKYGIYLNDYTDHTLEGLRNSADLILSKAKPNSVILDFTIAYLIDVFVGKGPEELVNYIVDNIDNYTQGCKVPLSERTVESIESIKQLRIGQIAPEIVSRDSNGKLIALSSLTKKNNVVMLYFWESSCTVCQAESPNIVKIYNKFKGRGFDIYAVALDLDKTKWLSAIKNYKLTWTNVSDLEIRESGAAKTYKIRATPTTYLLDNKGRIISKGLIGNELEMKIEEIFNRIEI